MTSEVGFVKLGQEVSLSVKSLMLKTTYHQHQMFTFRKYKAHKDCYKGMHAISKATRNRVMQGFKDPFNASSNFIAQVPFAFILSSGNVPAGEAACENKLHNSRNRIFSSLRAEARQMQLMGQTE